MSPVTVGAALISAFLFCARSHAAFDAEPVGPRSASLGNAIVAVPPDGWTPFMNPGGLAFCRSLSICAFHIPGLFGMTDLRFSGAGLSAPVAGFGVAISSSWFGWDLYRETSLRFAVAKELTAGIGVGLRLHMNRLAISAYGSCTSFTLDLGVRIECSRNLAIGGVLTNVTASALQGTGETLPQGLSGGIWYAPIPDLRVALEAGKELLCAPEIRCGVEADILTQMTLRAGIIDTPSIVSCGCAFRLGDIAADYAFAYHWVLGATHEIGLTISFP